ncbi:MAG: ATP-binding cassette domain-containing protein [Erysipelothrix sp.]|nr:ATP-binding cassette domain-containing protein [Erysipelothrix sp.]
MKNMVLKIRNLNKYYGDFHALKNVDLTLYDGDIYGLIGKNGAGKTTLFKQILGLSHYDGGHIEILGSENIKKGRGQVGYYISPNFFPYMNAYDNLKYMLKLKNIKDDAEIDRVLKLVGLSGVKKPFKSFSMGMKQRLGIANALLGNPRIIILDEPINGLDPQGIADIRSLIKMLNKEYGITFIVSSHILNELDLIATRFGMIDNGIMLEEIDRDELISSRKVFVLKAEDKSLQEYLNDKKLVFERQDDLYLISDVNDSSRFIKDLVINDISLVEAYYLDNNLESFYFSLTEGGIE